MLTCCLYRGAETDMEGRRDLHAALNPNSEPLCHAAGKPMIWFGHPAMAYTIYVPPALIGLSLPYVVTARAAGELGAGASPRSPATRLARRQTSRLHVSTQVTQWPCWVRLDYHMLCFHLTSHQSPAICLAQHHTSQLHVDMQSRRHVRMVAIPAITAWLRHSDPLLQHWLGREKFAKSVCLLLQPAGALSFLCRT